MVAACCCCSTLNSLLTGWKPVSRYTLSYWQPAGAAWLGPPASPCLWVGSASSPAEALSARPGKPKKSACSITWKWFASSTKWSLADAQSRATRLVTMLDWCNVKVLRLLLCCLIVSFGCAAWPSQESSHKKACCSTATSWCHTPRLGKRRRDDALVQRFC